MQLPAGSLHTVFMYHGLFLLLQFAVLAAGWFYEWPSSPALILPFMAGLSIFTLKEIWDARPRFQSRIVFLPACIIVLALHFCVLNSFTREYWAFSMYRFFPVWVQAITAQVTLLFIHPALFSPVKQAVLSVAGRLKDRGYLGCKTLAFLVAVGLLFWLLRSRYITEDGYDWIFHSRFALHWTNYLREPLSVLLFRLGTIFLPFEPYLNITILIIGCGLFAFWLLPRVVLALLPPFCAGYGLALALCSAGFTALFVGNIEVYALLQVGLLLWLFAVVRYWKGEWPAWRVGAMYGVLGCLHLSAVWWLPCFLAVPLISTNKNVLKDSLKQIGGFALVAGSFLLFTACLGYEASLSALLRHFQSDQVLYVGSDGAMFHPPSAFFTWPYYRDMLNEYFYLVPWMFVLAPVLVGGRVSWNAWGRQSAWIGALAGLYLLYSLLWHADRPLAKDWDIFSGVTLPLVLVCMVLVSRVKKNQQAIEYCLYQAIIFSGTYLLLQILRNHFRVTPYWPQGLF